jgi:class 3 adenylate cyclase
MPNLPSGTVTFVFSDIESSTALLKQLGDDAYADLLAIHRRLVRETFSGYHGQEIDTQGDAFFYSFARAREAVAAAAAVQQAHAEAKWPQGASVRLRLGLHTGEPAVGDEGYTGLDVVRASRIAAIGRGGQVLLSDTTRAIVADDLPDGVTLRALGQRRLRDIDRPEPLTELVIPGVEVAPEPSDAPVADGDDAAAWPFGVTDGPEIPAWVRQTARRFLPEGEARTLLEQRVLGAMTQAFDHQDARERDRVTRRSTRGRGGMGRAEPSSARSAPSMADELERLRSLRDTGALTPEQYARAVDRVISGGES